MGYDILVELDTKIVIMTIGEDWIYQEDEMTFEDPITLDLLYKLDPSI